MLKNRVFGELFNLKLTFLGKFIKQHVLGKLARIRKCKDVRVCPHAESVDIAFAMIRKSSQAYSHELTFSQLGIFHVEN